MTSGGADTAARAGAAGVGGAVGSPALEEATVNRVLHRGQRTSRPPRSSGTRVSSRHWGQRTSVGMVHLRGAVQTGSSPRPSSRIITEPSPLTTIFEARKKEGEPQGQQRSQRR